MRVLVVEDERLLGDQISRGLREERHIVDFVNTANAALEHATTVDYDSIILDVNLPGRDGFSLCRELRARGVRSFIIMVTARQAIEDRVRGLDVGADDYLTKPFAFAELLARLRALSRREPVLRLGPMVVGDLVIDQGRHRVERAGQLIALTAREYAIVELLARHTGQVMTRDQIAAGAWELGSEHASNVVDVFMRNLRRKIDDPFPDRVKLLQTVRGVGYRLDAAHAGEERANSEPQQSLP